MRTNPPSLRQWHDPASFLTAIGDALERREAANNLIFGLALQLTEMATASQPYLASIETSGEVTAALMTPPHHLIVFSESQDAEPLDAIALDIAVSGKLLPGVIGQKATARRFADCWSRLTGMPFHHEMAQVVYVLREVTSPPQAEGKLCAAEMSNLELASRWIRAFNREAIGKDNPERARKLAEVKIHRGELVFWHVNGEPVSCAARARPTPKGVAVNLVYTPPALRHRGYASACVAALSQRLLDEGFEFCTLFADLANPTSNGIYQRMGDREVERFEQLSFERPTSHPE